MERRPTVLVWHPGAPYATGDVARGLVAGLRANGARVVEYAQAGRFAEATHYLKGLVKRRRKAGMPLADPSMREIAHYASIGILEVAHRTRPDWIVTVNGGYQDPTFLVYLRDAGFRVALVATEAPYQVAAELHLARHVDHVFVNERSTVGLYAAVMGSASYLPAAWDPAVHVPTATVDDLDVPAHDVVFVGTGFEERVAWLEAIDWSGIDLGLYGHLRHCVRRRSPLRPYVRNVDTISNAHAAALYARAKVGINLHRTSVDFAAGTVHLSRAESANPRAYELAACGVAVVTDGRPEVRELYGAAGVPFVCDTPAAMGAAIRALLADDGRRLAWAAAARAAVAGESWHARAATVLEVLFGGRHAGRDGRAALAVDQVV